MTMTPAQRTLHARAAAYARWAREPDRAAAMRPANEGRWRRWEDEVDPDRVLPPAERHQRADALMRAHMSRMSLASSRKRTTTTSETGRSAAPPRHRPARKATGQPEDTRPSPAA